MTGTTMPATTTTSHMSSSSGSHAASANTSSMPAASNCTTTPYEVGWMFVREYYHFMHREPHRLHCFYGKDSSAQHGLEGVVVNIASGQQVHLSLYFICKVLPGPTMSPFVLLVGVLNFFD
jgi:hypothetical protein